MEMKFDPKAKVKQGDLNTSPEGLLISPSKEDVLANTGDGKFGYHEIKKFRSQLDANFDKLADEKDY